VTAPIVYHSDPTLTVPTNILFSGVAVDGDFTAVVYRKIGGVWSPAGQLWERVAEADIPLDIS
jgi:hypothetical protein